MAALTVRRIRIQAGQVTGTARLNASHTAEAIWQALPLEARANRWGDASSFGAVRSGERVRVEAVAA
jgi:hypothetical protein